MIDKFTAETISWGCDAHDHAQLINGLSISMASYQPGGIHMATCQEIMSTNSFSYTYVKTHLTVSLEINDLYTNISRFIGKLVGCDNSS